MFTSILQEYKFTLSLGFDDYRILVLLRQWMGRGMEQVTITIRDGRFYF